MPPRQTYGAQSVALLTLFFCEFAIENRAVSHGAVFHVSFGRRPAPRVATATEERSRLMSPSRGRAHSMSSLSSNEAAMSVF